MQARMVRIQCLLDQVWPTSRSFEEARYALASALPLEIAAAQRRLGRVHLPNINGAQRRLWLDKRSCPNIATWP
jgi:hypothetical protein